MLPSDQLDVHSTRSPRRKTLIYIDSITIQIRCGVTSCVSFSGALKPFGWRKPAKTANVCDNVGRIQRRTEHFPRSKVRGRKEELRKRMATSVLLTAIRDFLKSCSPDIRSHLIPLLNLPLPHSPSLYIPSLSPSHTFRDSPISDRAPPSG